MGPLGIIEVDPLADNPFGFEAVRQFVQVDSLVFERTPQSFDCLTSAPMEQISGIA
jgi:hypothetical protein